MDKDNIIKYIDDINNKNDKVQKELKIFNEIEKNIQSNSDNKSIEDAIDSYIKFNTYLEHLYDSIKKFDTDINENIQTLYKNIPNVDFFLQKPIHFKNLTIRTK